ncbi:OmpA family protein [Pontibacter harenae]|uniref:OmpA family protein n=1 Tax=Pontibacter harenae TaxID=2894083 RepID=UPI001E4301AB|nr:OmpA family protein [Pontibacter harenae]MCC9166523.1 OmpA family protein [Pontibacter harenae]
MKLKNIPLYIVVAATLGLAPAARAQSELRKADKHYENLEFALALEQYQKGLKKAKRQPDVQTLQRIADSYRLTRQSERAEVWYAKVIGMQGRDPMAIYHYAEALRSNGKHEEAKVYFMLWGEEVPTMEERAQQLVKACDVSMAWMEKLPVAEVEPLQNLNYASSSDFSPMQYGRGIIFTSDRGVGTDKKKDIYGWTGRPYLQLYTAEQDVKGNWSAPVPVQEVINDQYHNATASTTDNGKTIYFTRTHLVEKRKKGNMDPTSWVKEPEIKEYMNRLEIYSAQKDGHSWSNIQPFAFNDVEEYSVGHPALSPDGKVMYFASDMPGGMGETDIYYTLRQEDGSWGEPINAGLTINTEGRESFPYIDSEGQLFFASDGHIGFGGLDIFSAKGSLGKWESVKNLGYPINTPKNDYGIMFTEAGAKGLLSSNRDAANGTDDIYTFNMLKKPVVLAVTTLERKQNAEKRNIELPLPKVRLVVKEKSQSEPASVLSDAKGEYFMNARVGDSFTFFGSKDGYLNQQAVTNIPETANDTVSVALLFDKNEVERVIVLENIYYDLDKWDIRTDAAKELDKLVVMLKSNPSVNIEMGAHTDSRESYKYNQELSDKRAQAAVDYLVSQGVDRSRLRARGYGKTRLINGCGEGVVCSEEDHQLNRRTEFKIIKN